MAALRRAFPQAEWDVLTTTIDSQIAEEDKQNPAQWLHQMTCHGCGKREYRQQVCRASSVKFVSDGDQNLYSNPQSANFFTHEVYQVSSTLKGIFVGLDLSPPAPTPASPKRLRFQVDSGCSCNTVHVTDLNKLSPVRVDPSSVRLLDYSKSVIPTSGQTTLQCTRRGKSYKIIVQIISAEHYYVPLLRLADSIRMGIIHYDVDTANHLESTQTSSPSLV